MMESYHVNGKLMVPVDSLQHFGFSVIPVQQGDAFRYQLTFLEQESNQQELSLETANQYLQYWADGGIPVYASNNCLIAKGQEYPCFRVENKDIVAMDFLMQYGELIYQEEQRLAYAAIGDSERDTLLFLKSEMTGGDRAFRRTREYEFVTDAAGSAEEVIASAKEYIKSNIDPYFNDDHHIIKAPNENLISLTYCIGRYETDYEFSIRFKNGQAVSLIEKNERPARAAIPDCTSDVYVKLLDVDRSNRNLEVAGQEVTGKYESEENLFVLVVCITYREKGQVAENENINEKYGVSHQYIFQK